MNEIIEKNVNDEIDLFELLFSIWKKKLWIVLSTILFVLGAFIYIFNTKDAWVSKAMISLPDTSDMGDYFDIYNKFISISKINNNSNNNNSNNNNSNNNNSNNNNSNNNNSNNNNSNNNNSNNNNSNNNNSKVLSSYDISYSIGNKLYNAFVSSIYSNEKQQDFFKSRVLNDRTDGLIKKDLLYRLLSSVDIKRLGKSNLNKFIEIELRANNPDLAKKRLTDMIEYLNNDAKDRMLLNLTLYIKSRINLLEMEKNSIEKVSNFNRNIKLKNLESAIFMAKKAGIKNYSDYYNGVKIPNVNMGRVGVNIENDKLFANNFLFMLGEIYLKAQIDGIKEKDIVYPQSYYKAELEGDQLKRLLDDVKNISFNTFHYQSKPSLPLKSDKPKKAIIVLISMFLGIVVGVIFSLFLVAIENRIYKKKNI